MMGANSEKGTGIYQRGFLEEWILDGFWGVNGRMNGPFWQPTLKTNRHPGLDTWKCIDSNKRLANHWEFLFPYIITKHMTLSQLVYLMSRNIFHWCLLCVSPIRLSLNFLSYVCWKLRLNSFNSLTFIEITYIHVMCSFISMLPY